MSNTIHTIRPFFHPELQLWVFNDKDKDIQNEALVGGTEVVIGMACMDWGIRNPEKGFIVLFSSEKFKPAQFSLQWVRAESAGNVYRYTSKDGMVQEGWLCSVLLQYFKSPPKEIFIQLRNLN